MFPAWDDKSSDRAADYGNNVVSRNTSVTK